ncbi:MAG: type II toxin-antitoxin system PemK/MazF family toxin [Candidatus Omnitrophica bacterium]|nr:type II toxin-antitoxin system PemK/MazF family toxin [Candidatus Omnitrophota bacterium]
MEMKKFPERGEIYLVCLDPTVGFEINKTRPALIISNNINNQVAQTVTVIPVTSSTEKVYPFETLLSSGESGLSKSSKAKCNQIRTIDKKRLIKSLGKVSIEELKGIEGSLLIHLGMYLENK